MTIKELRDWLFKNGKEDQWWLALDATTESVPLTLSEIEARIRHGQPPQAQVLHTSQAEMSNPPWVDVDLSPTPAPVVPRAAVPPVADATLAARQSPQEALGIIALLIPLISTLLIWFWVGSMNLFQGPGSTLSALMVGTVVLTGLLIGLEASQLNIGSDQDRDKRGQRRSGPVAWAVLVMLLWVIGFPAYMGYRARYGAKNMIAGGILVALLLVGSGLAMNWAIEARVSEIRQGIEKVLRP